jgi:hypothetical protein
MISDKTACKTMGSGLAKWLVGSVMPYHGTSRAPPAPYSQPLWESQGRIKWVSVKFL